MSSQETILAALGGNALQRPDGEGTYEQQQEAVEQTAEILVDLIDSGARLVLTHGNGPQIGSIFRQNLEAADVTPSMPLFVNGAQSQGMIGFMIHASLTSKLAERDVDSRIVPLTSPVRVSPSDPAFDDPTKPIGPYLTEEQAADLKERTDLDIKQFGDRGYRQVVPSPEPEAIYNIEVAERMLERGDVPIIAGGGGIPVVESDSGTIKGVNAVIDKDLAGAHLGRQLEADTYVILTDVPYVALNYGEPDQRDIEEMSVETAREYLDEGHFGRGSMYEKVEAGCRFVEGDADRTAVITKLERAAEALSGDVGTVIHDR